MIGRSSRGSSSSSRPAFPGRTSLGDGLWLRHDLLEPLADGRPRAWGPDPPDLVEPPPFCDRIDFERFIVDTSHLRAVGGGEETGPSPVDRSKLGSKHAILTDGQGVPLVIDTIPANTPDANQAVPLVDAVPPIAGKPGHPRKRPDHVMGDRGFDDEEERQELWYRGIDPELAKRRTPHGSGLGVYRWVVERTISWLH